MADYTARTGQAGTMMIRDTGTVIEFWIKSDWTATYNYNMTWKLYYNGTWHNMPPVRYERGAAWLKMGSINVSGNQSICFHIDATGTSGLGGPTDFWYDVKRATTPSPPTAIGLDEVTATSMRYRFTSGSNGGSPVTEHQLGYGTSPTNAPNIVVSGGTSTITGLQPGTKYYFWSRARNAIGYGPWSARSDATTLTGVKVKQAGVQKTAIAMVKFNGTWRKAVPYVNHSGKWKEGI